MATKKTVHLSSTVTRVGDLLASDYVGDLINQYLENYVYESAGLVLVHIDRQGDVMVGVAGNLDRLILLGALTMAEKEIIYRGDDTE